MPHAVDQDELQYQADEDLLNSLLNAPPESGNFGGLDFSRDLEVGEKADDAEDFEDIGDDDLADDEDDITNAAPAPENGHERTNTAENGNGADDGFDDDMDFNFGDDLFGDDDQGDEPDKPDQVAQPPPPADQPADDISSPRSSLAGGLALPSTRIALPGNGPQKPLLPGFGTSATAHPSNISLEEDEEGDRTEEEEEEDEQVISQRLLFAQMRAEREERERRGASYEPPPAAEADLETFYNIWPTYDPEERPRFVELFPQRGGVYPWKTPVKPPKPVQPTKVNLELSADQEKTFRLPGTANTHNQWLEQNGTVFINHGHTEQEESDDGIDLDEIDETEVVGGVSWQDLALVCEDWDLPSVPSSPQADSGVDTEMPADIDMDGPPLKKRKVSHGQFDLKEAVAYSHHFPAFDEPERATAKIAKQVQLDMNDPGLLLDEHVPLAQPKKLRRLVGDMGREAKSAAARDMTRRYNISNDEAYELLKENHQSKVRATLGSMPVEHSQPASKLQYPFYRVALDEKQKRSFHRPTFTGERHDRTFGFSKIKKVKKKELKGKEASVVFAKAEDLSMADNSNALLLEYSEEQPVMLSNFGMGNRLINYYRRKDGQDTSRPKEELGETQVLLPQDRSPFANFGQVDPGEMVPTIHNGLYRAPIFKHEPKSTDFLLISNFSLATGRKWYMRNIENIHAVGQQFPSVEVPGEHSRKVTDAAKRRLHAISYRIHKKYLENRGPPLTNEVVKMHLPGSDVAQNRGKMREFMQYDKNNALWELKQGKDFPPIEEVRTWIRPEDICMLDSMQVGVQHLKDLGLKNDEEEKKGDDDAKDDDNIEILLAPWNTTKNFMHATQGKAMLQLHGEGDPTARGEGFSFIKTSMKGGFRALGESVAERLDAKKLKENGGHSYNVAKQQKAYDESIRRIWRAQHESLASAMEHSDVEDDIDDEPESARQGPGETPRSSFGTPSAFGRRDDETMSQFSKFSSAQNNNVMYIERTVTDKHGVTRTETERVTNPRVIAAYKKHKEKERLHTAELTYLQLFHEPAGTFGLHGHRRHNLTSTGDRDLDLLAIKKYANQDTKNEDFDGLGIDAFLSLDPAQELISNKMRRTQEEIDRLQRNMDRRKARERAKGLRTSPDAADSPAQDGEEGGDSQPSAPNGKGKRAKKNTEGTARKCANCGQVGHIKTNKKLCPMLNGTMKQEDVTASGFGGPPGPPGQNGDGGAFGSMSMPLAL